eukprot:751830-Amphidinium_carterae.1
MEDIMDMRPVVDDGKLQVSSRVQPVNSNVPTVVPEELHAEAAVPMTRLRTKLEMNPLTKTVFVVMLLMQ